jgi:hypothetical protein
MSYPYPPPHPSQGAPKNGLGTAGFVLGLIGLIFAWIPIIGVIAWPLVLLGLIFSLLGLARARQGTSDNKGIAIAGIACSAIGLLICIIYAAAFASAVSDAPSRSMPTTTIDSGRSAPVAEAVTATTSALPTGTIPGDGFFRVGTDIQPGTYRSTGAQEGIFEFCSWSTKKGAVSNSDTVDFGTANANEPMVVEIGKNTKGFQTSNCEPWVKVE